MLFYSRYVYSLHYWAVSAKNFVFSHACAPASIGFRLRDEFEQMSAMFPVYEGKVHIKAVKYGFFFTCTWSLTVPSLQLKEIRIPSLRERAK